MLMSRLGRTNLAVPTCGFGGIPIGRDHLNDDEAVNVLKRAIDAGRSYGDTGVSPEQEPAALLRNVNVLAALADGESQCYDAGVHLSSPGSSATSTTCSRTSRLKAIRDGPRLVA